MNESHSAVTRENLTSFFSDYIAAHGNDANVLDLPQRLEKFFQELPYFSPTDEITAPPSPIASDLAHFFATIQAPLKAEKERGGFLNFWSIAGLNGYEVRTAGALAGLWHYDFGGEVSRTFVGNYLEKVIPGRNWEEELRRGYNVYTEVNPLGDVADRVDLLVETDRSLVGIEIKIRAGLGERQLERYELALKARAVHIGKSPFLIFLAPYQAQSPGVYLSTWKDVSASARLATICRSESWAITHHIIAQFGEHVFNH